MIYPSKMEPPFVPPPAENVTLDKWNPGIADVMRAKPVLRQPVAVSEPHALTVNDVKFPDQWYRPMSTPRWGKKEPLRTGLTAIDARALTEIETVNLGFLTGLSQPMFTRRRASYLSTRTPAFVEVFPIDWFPRLMEPAWKVKPRLQGTVVIDPSTTITAEQITVDKWRPNIADILRRRPMPPIGVETMDWSAFPTLPHLSWYFETARPVWRTKPIVAEGQTVTDPSSFGLEFITVDKWEPSAPDILWKLRPIVNEGFSVMGLAPSGSLLAMRWFQNLATPRFDAKRQQWLFPHFSIDPPSLSSAELSLLSKWFTEMSTPRWSRPNLPHLRPAYMEALGPIVQVLPSATVNLKFTLSRSIAFRVRPSTP